MSWLDLPRVPEPEVMDDAGEVQAYSSAAAQEYLSKIDDTFVEHAVRLAAGVAAQKSPVKFTLRLLDIGSGPGQIILKLAPRLSFWQLLGVDRSPNMIRQAIAVRCPGGEPPARHRVLAICAIPRGGWRPPPVRGRKF